MVTALNHAVADGRRAGGLNLSPSILTDYRGRDLDLERESERERNDRGSKRNGERETVIETA
jgi:hypothetical protein